MTENIDNTMTNLHIDMGSKFMHMSSFFKPA